MLASISQAIAAGKSDTPVTCDPIVPIENFDESKYAGNWYEQMHVKDPQEPKIYQCSQASYTDLTDDETDPTIKHFKVYNSFQTKVLGLWTPRIGVHAKAYCNTSASCHVSFAGKTPEAPNLTVLDTDYTGYAINYWCDTDSNLVRVWINTREPSVSDEYFNEIYAKAMALVPSFDQSTFDPRITQGDMCSYHEITAAPSVYELLSAKLF